MRWKLSREPMIQNIPVCSAKANEKRNCYSQRELGFQIGYWMDLVIKQYFLLNLCPKRIIIISFELSLLPLILSPRFLSYFSTALHVSWMSSEAISNNRLGGVSHSQDNRIHICKNQNKNLSRANKSMLALNNYDEFTQELFFNFNVLK